MQIIYKFREIFERAGVGLWLRPYEIIVTSQSSGIIEFLPNTQSLDGIKKNTPGYTNLLSFYQQTFKGRFPEA